MPLRRRSEPSQSLQGFDAEALAGIVAATQAVNQSNDLSATLETVLDEAIKLLRADEGSVMLYTEGRSVLEIGAARGLPRDVIESTRLTPGSGIAGYVAESGSPLLLGSGDDVSRYADDKTKDRRLTSAVSVPLRTNGVVEGVLNVNLLADSDRGAFEDSDLELASIFAEVAASAVRHAQLYRQARGRAADLGFLVERSHQLSSAVSVDEVANAMLDAAAELVDAHGGFVAAVPAGGSEPELIAVREVAQGRVLAVLRRGSAELLKEPGPRVVADVESDTILGPLGAYQDPMGAVSVRLEGGAHPIGLLVALRPPGQIGDRERDLLTTYGSHAGLALARAMLFRSVQSKEEELTSLAGSVPDPIVIADGAGKLLAINPAASELFGLNADFDIGHSIRGKLNSEVLEELLMAGEPGRAEVTLLTPEPRTFRARATPTLPGHGPAGGRILIVEDVTTEREMDKAKADFLAVIGHELRTPLTLVTGYASTLVQRGDTLPPEARNKAIEAIQRQAVKLERLIEDLLLVSRIEHHRPPLRIERHDIVATVHGAVQAAKATHPNREFKLSANGREREMPIDVTKVEQIMHHLLDNAIKFSDADDPVEIRVELRADEVEVRVTDHGIGIFSGDIPQLFQRFHQIDGTHTRAHGGTGVGLYICKTLVEAHGGQISVRSALGHGSEFYFTLPMTPPVTEEGPDDA